MKALLRCVSGPGTGLEIALEPGLSISVGRSEMCSVSVPGDRFLSSRHFEVVTAEDQLLLRDPGSSNGTFVNGTRVREHALQGGEDISAGQCVFQVEIHRASVPSVVDVLSGQPEPLYAVLDAARDPAIYPLLLTSGAEYVSLYMGKSALELEPVAPYLVRLPPHCELLQKIVAQGWSKSWGIFLTSSQPPQMVWHELRRSLMVTLETTQTFVYFRFYDPRVLRVILPITDAQQRVELCGTISSFLMEDESPDLMLQFSAFPAACEVHKLPVSPPTA